jgi:hypothetical protein
LKDVRVFPAARSVVANKPGYFAVTTGAAGDYDTDASATFDHLTIRGEGPLLSCPGGPSAKKYGLLYADPHVHALFSGPVARQGRRWLTPVSRAGAVLRIDADDVVWTLRYKHFVLERRIRFHATEVSVSDQLRFRRSAEFDEIRFCSLPIQSDFFRIVRLDPAGVECEGRRSGVRVSIRSIRDSDTDHECPWTCRETAMSAAGPVTVLSRGFGPFRATAGATVAHEFVVAIVTP